MRIVIISRESAADRRYGLGVAVGRIADGLRARGHEVCYRSKADWTDRQQQQCDWLSRRLPVPAALRGAFAERLVQGWQATDFALREQASHVWLQDPWLAAGMQWRLRCGARWRAPFRWGVSEHGLGSFAWAVAQDGIELDNAQYRRLLVREKAVLDRADWVWSPSRTALDALRRDLGYHSSPASWQAPGYGAPELDKTLLEAAAREAVHSGAAAAAKPAAPETVDQAPDGQQSDAPLIVAAGRLATVKRYDILIEALLLLRQQHGIDARLWIAGEGSVEDLPASAGLLRYAPRVEPVQRIETVLGAGDVYVSCCAAESFGLANREAVAAGLPSLIASGGASNEVLGGGAWLLPARAEAFADALQVLLTRPEAQEFWHEQALQAAAHWTSWDDRIRDYEELLTDV